MRQWLHLFIPTGLLIVLSGCHSLEWKDQTFRALKPTGLGAHEAHTLFTPERDLTEQEWQVIRNSGDTQFCQSASDFAWQKKAWETMCSWHQNECIPEVQEKMQAFFRKVRRIQTELSPMAPDFFEEPIE